MNFKLRFIALLLVVIMCLSSCEMFGMGNNEPQQTDSTVTEPTTTTTTTTAKPTKPPLEVSDFDLSQHTSSKSDLEKRYTLTPEEVEAAVSTLDAMVQTAQTSEDYEAVWASYEVFEEAYYHIAQQRTIAMIIYYYDMSDEVSSTRYTETVKMFNSLQDKYTQSCKEMLDTPHKDKFFDGWSDDELESLRGYDPAISELRNEISELEVLLDQLSDADLQEGTKLVELYKQLIMKNNKLAKYYGYENYYDYATVNVYGRDYEKEDLEVFREYLVKYIVPSIQNAKADYYSKDQLSKTKKSRVEEFTEKAFDTAPKRNYLVAYLESLDGSMGEGMRHMFDNKNCIFSYSGSSHSTAFQTYLYEDETPFCLFGSSGHSATTLVHEIGHYYAAVTNPDIDNYDLCETHSQSNEFLLITFCEKYMDDDVYKSVRGHQIFMSCYPMIMGALVDGFEQRVYSLTDAELENMTVKDFDAIMTDVCNPYGGVNWVKGMFSDPLFYWKLVAPTSPVYYISYAVSAIAALEVYAIAQNDYEAALDAYTKLVVGITPEDGFLGALEKAGLGSPFEEETFINIQKVLAE